jgi:rod shape determining protein RodA
MKPAKTTSFLREIDLFILIPALLLIAAGLLSIYSATHNAELIVRFQKQVFWVILGLLACLLTLLAPPRFFHYSAWFLYGGGILLLLLVLLFGRSVAGNAGWFGIGGFGIQPSEFVKVTTIIALARYLSDSTTKLGELSDVAKAIGIAALPWFLIFMQPDFGTGLVYWAVFVIMLFWAGAEMLLLLLLLSPVIVAILSVIELWYFLLAAVLISGLYYVLKRNLGTALIFLALNLTVGFSVQYTYDHLPEYQKARIAAFIDPTEAPLTTGWNVIQSKVAVGSGGLSGKGYLQGSQTQLRFVPEQWTDFIFCVPAEEFGFLGASAILLLFAIFLVRGLVIARKLEYRFSSLLVIGIMAMFFFHVLVNTGMTMGIMPVVGIPLPFMSYGGSFFITTMIATGIVLNLWLTRHRLS